MSLGQAPVDENWLRERTQQLLDELADADELEFLRAQYDAGLAWVQFPMGFGGGDGWRVAVSTLMNERVSIGGAVVPRGSGHIEFAVDAWREYGHDDPARREELMRLWVAAEVARLGSIRAQQLREQGTPGPEGSILKLARALLGQEIMSFAVELMGPAGMLVPGYVDEIPGENLQLTFLRVQASTIAGGTTEIMKNILGERVLGLPGDPRADKEIPWSKVPKGA